MGGDWHLQVVDTDLKSKQGKAVTLWTIDGSLIVSYILYLEGHGSLSLKDIALSDGRSLLLLTITLRTINMDIRKFVLYTILRFDAVRKGPTSLSTRMFVRSSIQYLAILRFTLMIFAHKSTIKQLFYGNSHMCPLQREMTKQD